MLEGLSAEEVLSLHDAQLARYGGSPGLRDPGLLESALAQPTQELFGQLRHPTVPAQAAASLYRLARAHAFVDGNKRTALNCALVWLDLHDLRLTASQEELYGFTLEVAQGRLTLDHIIQFFESLTLER